MKNEFSRRNFLRFSGAVLATAALTGTLTGCKYDKGSVKVESFNKELTAGKCKVTFLTVGGTRSWNIIQQVTLKVENLGNEEIILEKKNFTVMMNDSQKLEVGSCSELINDVATGGKDHISVAAGKETEISLWLAADSQPDADKVQTVTASVTINGVTVKAIEPKENFKWWYG